MFVNLLTPRTGPPVELGRVTVVMGPNRSGKSTLLGDIFRLCTGRDPGSDYEQAQLVQPVILEDMQFGGTGSDQQQLEAMAGPQSEGGVLEGLGGDLRRLCRAALRSEAWNIVKRPVLHARSMLETELPAAMLLRTAFLGSETLDVAAASGPACSPLATGRSLLQLLHQADDSVRAELDAAFTAAFPPTGLRLDDTQRVQLTLRLAEEFPPDEMEPVRQARQWSELCSLDEAGRGCRHFAALTLAVLLLPGRIILCDEVDAHLQPLAARQLGRWLGHMVSEQDSQLILSARNPSLVAGLIERCQDVALLRLNREPGEPARLSTASVDQAREVAKSPLLSLDDALAALFRQGAVLVEAPDETQALAALNYQRGGADRWQFLCVQSARQAAPLLRLYRDAGLPAAVVGPLTALRNKDDYHKLLTAACRGKSPPQSWLATRDQLARHVESIVDQESLSANTQAMEKLLGGLEEGQAEPEIEEEEAVAAPRDPWSAVDRRGLAAISLDQRSWLEQLLEELKSAGVFLRGFPGSAVGLGANSEQLTQLLRNIRGGQAPDRLAVMLSEVVQYLRSPVAREPVR